MNSRKPIDYSTLFSSLDTPDATNLPQIELYCGNGCMVSGRLEKGPTVDAAEYLQGAYSDETFFSPRSLRRMQDFYRTYENTPEVITKAMTIEWTQNIATIESEFTLQEKMRYIRAVQQFGGSKLELTEQIASAAHLGEDIC